MKGGAAKQQKSFGLLLLAKKNAIGKRVEHKLAKYSASGELLCALCGTRVEDAALWEAHLRGQQHADTVDRLKAVKQRKLEEQERTKRNVDNVDDDEGVVAVQQDEEHVVVVAEPLSEPMVELLVEYDDVVDVGKELDRFQQGLSSQGNFFV